MSYFEIYQEKIRDLLSFEKSSDPPPRATRPRTPTFTVSEVGSPVEGERADEDRSSQSEYVLEECNHPAVQADDSALEVARAESDPGFTVIDELGNAMEGRPQQPKIESTARLKAKRKSSMSTTLKDATPQKRSNQFSSLVFGDSGGVKKETFLRVREHPVTGPYVEGLIWKEVREWADMERLFKQGAANRTTYATDMNEHSSRSHALCTIKVTRVQRVFIFYLSFFSPCNSL